MLLVRLYTGIRFDGTMRSCYQSTGRYEGRLQPLSFGHYEALTGPVDYYPRGNGYNTSFRPTIPLFSSKTGFQSPSIARILVHPRVIIRRLRSIFDWHESIYVSIIDIVLSGIDELRWLPPSNRYGSFWKI